MGIVTDSKTVSEPKDPGTCTVYLLHKLFLSPAEGNALAEDYRRGGLGYGEAKKRLLQAFLTYFGPMRKRRSAITEDEAARVMTEGAKRASAMARKMMLRVRKAVGLY